MGAAAFGLTSSKMDKTYWGKISVAVHLPRAMQTTHSIPEGVVTGVYPVALADPWVILMLTKVYRPWEYVALSLTLF